MILVASDMGIEPSEAVVRVEVHDPSKLVLCDRTRWRRPRRHKFIEAMTVGPRFSADIEAAMDPPGKVGDELSGNSLAAGMSRARSSGADIAKWVRAVMLRHVAGAAAEAKLLGRPIDDVLNEVGSERDLMMAVADGLLAELSPEEIWSAISDAIVQCTRILERPEVWATVLAVADRILADGEVDGATIANVVASVLPAGFSPTPRLSGAD
jgi:hypothetical protein